MARTRGSGGPGLLAYVNATSQRKEHTMAVDRGRRGGIGGISIGGILVIIGVIVAIVWSLWLGIIIALIGLIAFGGFVRGRWY
jgi:hypothetical protein